jgi:hypothetical protein
MTEIKQHRDVPAGVHVDQRNSGSMRSTPAGGELPRSEYMKQPLGAAPSTTQPAPAQPQRVAPTPPGTRWP